MTLNNETSSFRDPSGRIFWQDRVLYRTVNKSYGTHYDLLINSGLSKELIAKKLLINFQEVDRPEGLTDNSNVYKWLQPQVVPFVSYPYEWSFSQLKDAALCTLEIQKTALSKGMTLKDASAYNIQFLSGKPVLIDLLSFESYIDSSPWHAYGQFCRHFVAPLLLASYVDPRLLVLSKENIDGIPLDLVSNMLPLKAKTNLLYLMHIALQNKTKKYVTSKKVSEVKLHISKSQSLALIEDLINGIKNLKPHALLTTWGDYYNFTNYSDSAMKEKTEIVEKWTKDIRPSVIWDLGGNNGKFCRDINYADGLFICMDFDFAAIEDCYQKVNNNKEKNILPLIIDLTNPTSGVGWANKERKSIQSRGPADLIYALALIHHLAIGNNLPFEYIRDYFKELSDYLIIEFVPKEDSMTQKLLELKTSTFENYTVDNFEKVFTVVYKIEDKVKLKDSSRVIYLMKKI